MTEEEICHRIALLFNPMPDMSGNNINRLRGRQRREVENLAHEIVSSYSVLPIPDRDAIARIWWNRVCPTAWIGRWDEAKTLPGFRDLVIETADDAAAILEIYRSLDRIGDADERR